MNTTVIMTTAFPMVIAILTIYLTNFFSERSKRQDFFRNKKHEHIPHIYKEMSLIHIKFSQGVTREDYKELLPPYGSDFKSVSKYLSILGLSEQDIASIEKLWEKDYEEAKYHFDQRLAETNVENIERRVEELHEYWLTVALYLKPALNKSIANIYQLFKDCVRHEYKIVWYRYDMGDQEIQAIELRKKINKLHNDINEFYNDARSFLEKK